MPYPFHSKYDKSKAKSPKKSKKAKVTPILKYKSNWYFNNRDDVCKEVWQAGEKYMTLFQNKATRPRIHMKYPALLTKYMFFLYLSGSRCMEPILSENLQLEVRSDSGNNYIYVKRVNEKHHEANGERQQIEVIIPIFCEYERKMWKYITTSGKEMNTKQIFQFDKWCEATHYDGKIYPSKLTHDKLNRYIANFKIDLRDNNNSLKRQCKLTPHILRHMRAFNMLINHRAPDSLIVGIMGWSNTQMLYYYAHLRNMLKQENMLRLAKESGFLDRKFNLEAPDLKPIGPMYSIPS